MLAFLEKLVDNLRRFFLIEMTMQVHMMILRRIKPYLMALAVVGVVGSTSIAHSANLKDPEPSLWGCDLSPEQVLQGIRAGLVGRGWIVTEDDGQGNLVAQILVRAKHTLIVDIVYNDQSFDINYKDSDNLDYRIRRNGTVNIHRNANSWMNNIRMDITAQLSALCALNL